MSAILAADLERAAAPVLQRARGRARIAFRHDEGVDRLQEFHQEGCCKIRLPRVEPGAPPEAVLLNTAGGVTGGDRLTYEIALGEKVRAVGTTQAAERIYRRSAGAGEVANRISVGSGGHIDWIPQETILFDRSALSRRLEVDLAGDATALLVETIVFGRAAMGETVREVHLSDRWRVRRDGRIVYADGVQIEGDAETMLRSGATGGGASAISTVLLVGDAAPTRLDAVRDIVATLQSESGASAWPGLLAVRLVAPNSRVLRLDLMKLIEAVRGRPMPRVWHC